MIKYTDSIILAGGCFWCLEASFVLFKGVKKVIPGYIGGVSQNPNYDEVCSGKSGHAEAVKIEYDKEKISQKFLLKIFFTIHDPTQLNRQGNDIGSQYRSGIFLENKNNLNLIESSIKDAKSVWGDNIVTTIEINKEFYKAEDYHNNYFYNNPNSGYCQAIISPKVSKLRSSFLSKMKK